MVTSAKFLGLTIDNLLKWDNHIYQLISKLSSASYVIRSLRAVGSKNTLRLRYFSYVHSIITYGIIFWGNTPNGIKIFKMQKQIIRITTNSGKMDSCRALFKRMKILPLYSQYTGMYIFTIVIYNK
jgi:hypothetical protein